MSNYLVLGAGMVGSVIATDLAADAGAGVTIADVRPAALEAAVARAARLGRKLQTVQADLSNPEAIERLAGAEGVRVVCGALASHLGLMALEAVLRAGRSYCDISFMPEDVHPGSPAGDRLGALAAAKGVTAVVDFGVAPGMSHLLAAEAARRVAPCRSIEIYVGGLPRERRWPFEYKAGFSPADVIEEYTRPARLVEHGQVVTRPALSEPELMNFEGVGTLEAFNTDGLRSLAYTTKVPFMKEKTLRYPGHIELMRVMRETGLFSREAVSVRDEAGREAKVRPLDVTSAVLFPKWTYAPGEADLTVMRVSATGDPAGRAKTVTFDVLDFYDPASGATSMSRTTAFPCAIMARLLASGRYRRPGVVVPELVAESAGVADEILAEQAKRGVNYRVSER